MHFLYEKLTFSEPRTAKKVIVWITYRASCNESGPPSETTSSLTSECSWREDTSCLVFLKDSSRKHCLCFHMESIHLNQLKYYVQGFSRGHSEQMFSRNELPSAQMICSEYMNLNILLVRTALALLRSKEHVLQTGCDRTNTLCGALYRLYRSRFCK